MVNTLPNTVVALYRSDIFSTWSNIKNTSEDEVGYFIKVTTENEDLYFILGTQLQSYFVNIE